MNRRKLSVMLPVLAVLVLGMALWFVGVFEAGRIPPGKAPAPGWIEPPAFQDVVLEEALPTHYVTVGTIRARTNATVSAQANGRVTRVLVDTGQSVDAGDLLATLDGKEQETRVSQASSSLEAARAELADAGIHHGRMKRLLPEKAVTYVQMDQAEARLRQARANVNVARKKVEESKIVLDYTRILAPTSGVVDRREADPGELAWPGKPLFVIHDPAVLRLEASVREGMIGRVQQDKPVEVEIPALSRTMEGSVDEIAPSADSVSRSFLVKISLPAAKGIYPGMFGRLKITLRDRPALLIPAVAVSKVGQLKTVRVVKDGLWIRRYVTLGEHMNDTVEVLSGLSAGDIVGWDSGDRDLDAEAAGNGEDVP